MTGVVSQVPLDLELRTPAGEPAILGDYLAAPVTVVQLVRYFGCLPCQEWLIELDRAAAAEKIGALAVGGSADYQAVWLQEARGVRMPLLLDPVRRFRKQVGAVKPLGWRMADPRGGAAYVRSLRHGLRPQAVTRDTVRSPGVVVLDRDGGVRWSYIGTRIGDYPPINLVLDVASRL